MDVSFLPAVNASLNAIATVLLIMGYRAIRAKNERKHILLMLSALSVSAIFLTTYLIYHFNTQAVTKYEGEGIIRIVYFFILLTHIPLAAGVLPFILMVVRHAFRRDRVAHRKLARKVFPVWLYVSVTGVLIFLMLKYQ
jgi:uncharacterized membrane protein YozB (DUF420 family)